MLVVLTDRNFVCINVIEGLNEYMESLILLRYILFLAPPTKDMKAFSVHMQEAVLSISHIDVSCTQMVSIVSIVDSRFTTRSIIFTK